MELKEIIREIRERGLTAYEIAKNTPLTEVGINKILNGESKRPHNSTLNELRKYLRQIDSPTSYAKPSYSANQEVEEKLKGITNEELAHILVARFDDLMGLDVVKLLIEREVWKKQSEIKDKAYRDAVGLK